MFESALINQVIKVMSETLVPANPDILDGVDDLMQLSYLNEPSVLYNLNYRYNEDMIYVSLSPPESVDHICFQHLLFAFFLTFFFLLWW